MRSRACAWMLALIALILAVVPMAGMADFFGFHPMSIVVTNSLWIGALVLTVVALIMAVHQGTRTRA